MEISGIESNLLGYCGIDCSTCPIRQAALDKQKAEALAIQWQEHNPEAKAEWFQCQGCKGPVNGHWAADCEILRCARKKTLDHCGQCIDFKCIHILKFQEDGFQHHAAAIKYLETLQASST